MLEDKNVCADRVLESELENIGPKIDKNRLLGIAISGGGIRSASFGIGVLQSIHACTITLGGESKKSLFDEFDYLSTVSGGGYAGTALSWFRRNRSSIGPSDSDKSVKFPFGERGSGNIPLNQIDVNVASDSVDQSTPPAPEKILDYLRLHGKYLVPTEGLGLISLVGTLLRGILVSSTYYFIVLSFLLMLVLGTTRSVNDLMSLVPYIDGFVESSIISACEIKTWLEGRYSCTTAFTANDRLMLKFSVILTVLAAFIIVLLTVVNTMGQLHRLYRARNIVQRAIGYLIKIAISGVLIFTIPCLIRILDESSIFGIVAGLVAAYTRFRVVSGQVPLLKKFPRVGSTSILVASAIFIYVLLLYAYLMASLFWELEYVTASLFSGWGYIVLLSLGVFVIGFLININYSALGRMYRDRLMETFMADDRAVKQNKWYSATSANKFPLSELCKNSSSSEGSHGRPYHLINANAVMVNEEEVRLRSRGGTSFLFSPLYIGSDATAYVSTSNYMRYTRALFSASDTGSTFSNFRIKDSGFSAATAMAISGAAANPHTGVGGEGNTRNALVSFLMTFFNIRLGYWAANPNYSIAKRANIFYPGIPSLFGFGFKKSSRFIELSDGGHFENLALYELLRRRCKFIIVSDAGADEDFNFSDLGNAVERARADFGISIRFDKIHDSTGSDEHYDLQHLLPGTSGEEVFAQKFQLAKRGFALASIEYPCKEGCKNIVGLLLYIKTSLTAGLPSDLYGYKAKHPSYPDQPTADQFFDEAQFEAYRELGYQTTKNALNDTFVADQIHTTTGLNLN